MHTNQSQEDGVACCRLEEPHVIKEEPMVFGDATTESVANETHVESEELPGSGEGMNIQKEQVEARASANEEHASIKREKPLISVRGAMSSAKDTKRTIVYLGDETIAGEACKAKRCAVKGRAKTSVIRHASTTSTEVEEKSGAAEGNLHPDDLPSKRTRSQCGALRNPLSEEAATVKRNASDSRTRSQCGALRNSFGEEVPSMKRNASDSNSAVVHKEQPRLHMGQSKGPKEKPGQRRSYVCKDCNKVCTTAEHLRKHGAVHNRTKPCYTCDVCSKAFSVKIHLTRHKDIHTNTKSHMCRYCGQTFTQMTTLAQHERLHTGERPYTCHICLKSYIQQSGLDYHMRSHTGEKPYLCPECGRAYASQAALKYHRKAVHESKERQARQGPQPKTKCPVCEKVVSTSQLRRHVRRHDAGTEKAHKCLVCNKGFFEKRLLKVHSRVHDNIRPYACKYCPKKFIRLSNQTEHERTHTGDRPYKCKLCFKSFAQISTLGRHERLHTGEKPFQCKKCGKSFTQPSGLIGHQKSCTKPAKAMIMDVEEVAMTGIKAEEPQERSVVVVLPPGMSVVEVVTETHSS